MIEGAGGAPLCEAQVTVRDAERAHELAARLLAEDRAGYAAEIFEGRVALERLVRMTPPRH
ncbi:MAG: hypothetical protein ACHP84_17810 [Caulobacterales bacterium]